MFLVDFAIAIGISLLCLIVGTAIVYLAVTTFLVPAKMAESPVDPLIQNSLGTVLLTFIAIPLSFISMLFSVAASILGFIRTNFAFFLAVGLVLFGLILWLAGHQAALKLFLVGWQCFARVFFDDFFLPFLNLLRMVYNVAWPFVNVGVEWFKFYSFGVPKVLLSCAWDNIDFGYVVHLLASAGWSLVAGAAGWFSGAPLPPVGGRCPYGYVGFGNGTCLLCIDGHPALLPGNVCLSGFFLGRIETVNAWVYLADAVVATRLVLQCFCSVLQPVWDLLVWMVSSPHWPVCLDCALNFVLRGIQLGFRTLLYQEFPDFGPLLAEEECFVTSLGQTVQDWLLAFFETFLGIVTIVFGFLEAEVIASAASEAEKPFRRPGVSRGRGPTLGARDLDPNPPLLFRAFEGNLDFASASSRSGPGPLHSSAEFLGAERSSARVLSKAEAVAENYDNNNNNKKRANPDPPPIPVFDVPAYGGPIGLELRAFLLTPWARIFSEPVVVVARLINMTAVAVFNVERIFTQTDGSQVRFFQFGHVIDRVRIAAGSIASLVSVLDPDLGDAALQFMLLFLQGIEALLELAIGELFWVFFTAPVPQNPFTYLQEGYWYSSEACGPGESPPFCKALPKLKLTLGAFADALNMLAQKVNRPLGEIVGASIDVGAEVQFLFFNAVALAWSILTFNHVPPIMPHGADSLDLTPLVAALENLAFATGDIFRQFDSGWCVPTLTASGRLSDDKRNPMCCFATFVTDAGDFAVETVAAMLRFVLSLLAFIAGRVASWNDVAFPNFSAALDYFQASTCGLGCTLVTILNFDLQCPLPVRAFASSVNASTIGTALPQEFFGCTSPGGCIANLVCSAEGLSQLPFRITNEFILSFVNENVINNLEQFLADIITRLMYGLADVARKTALVLDCLYCLVTHIGGSTQPDCGGHSPFFDVVDPIATLLEELGKLFTKTAIAIVQLFLNFFVMFFVNGNPIEAIVRLFVGIATLLFANLVPDIVDLFASLFDSLGLYFLGTILRALAVGLCWVGQVIVNAIITVIWIISLGIAKAYLQYPQFCCQGASGCSPSRKRADGGFFSNPSATIDAALMPWITTMKWDPSDPCLAAAQRYAAGEGPRLHDLVDAFGAIDDSRLSLSTPADVPAQEAYLDKMEIVYCLARFYWPAGGLNMVPVDPATTGSASWNDIPERVFRVYANGTEVSGDGRAFALGEDGAVSEIFGTANVGLSNASDSEPAVTYVKTDHYGSESVCDGLVAYRNARLTNWRDIGPFEQLELLQCFKDRAIALGFRQKMPWFPADMLNNPYRKWIWGYQLGKGALVYLEYFADKSVSPDTLSSPGYLNLWSKSALSVDHLRKFAGDPKAAAAFQASTKLKDYFIANNATQYYAIKDASLAFWSFVEKISLAVGDSSTSFSNSQTPVTATGLAASLLGGVISQDTAQTAVLESINTLFSSFVKIMSSVGNYWSNPDNVKKRTVAREATAVLASAAKLKLEAWYSDNALPWMKRRDAATRSNRIVSLLREGCRLASQSDEDDVDRVFVSVQVKTEKKASSAKAAPSGEEPFPCARELLYACDAETASLLFVVGDETNDRTEDRSFATHLVESAMERPSRPDAPSSACADFVTSDGYAELTASPVRGRSHRDASPDDDDLNEDTDAGLERMTSNSAPKFLTDLLPEKLKPENWQAHEKPIPVVLLQMKKGLTKVASMASFQRFPSASKEAETKRRMTTQTRGTKRWIDMEGVAGNSIAESMASVLDLCATSGTTSDECARAVRSRSGGRGVVGFYGEASASTVGREKRASRVDAQTAQKKKIANEWKFDFEPHMPADKPWRRPLESAEGLSASVSLTRAAVVAGTPASRRNWYAVKGLVQSVAVEISRSLSEAMEGKHVRRTGRSQPVDADMFSDLRTHVNGLSEGRAVDVWGDGASPVAVDSKSYFRALVLSAVVPPCTSGIDWLCNNCFFVDQLVGVIVHPSTKLIGYFSSGRFSNSIVIGMSYMAYTFDPTQPVVVGPPAFNLPVRFPSPDVNNMLYFSDNHTKIGFSDLLTLTRTFSLEEAFSTTKRIARSAVVEVPKSIAAFLNAELTASELTLGTTPLPGADIPSVGFVPDIVVFFCRLAAWPFVALFDTLHDLMVTGSAPSISVPGAARSVGGWVVDNFFTCDWEEEIDGSRRRFAFPTLVILAIATAVLAGTITQFVFPTNIMVLGFGVITYVSGFFLAAFMTATYSWSLFCWPGLPWDLGNDLFDFVAYSLFPKFPYLIGGLINEPFTATDCYSCAAAASFTFPNCWYGMGFAWFPDNVFFTLFVHAPSVLQSLSSSGGIVQAILQLVPGLQEGLTKWNGVDLRDPIQYSQHMQCNYFVTFLPNLFVLLAFMALFFPLAIPLLVSVLSWLWAALLFPIILLFGVIVNMLRSLYYYAEFVPYHAANPSPAELGAPATGGASKTADTGTVAVSQTVNANFEALALGLSSALGRVRPFFLSGMRGSSASREPLVEPQAIGPHEEISEEDGMSLSRRHRAQAVERKIMMY